jgi:hypothetical protein
MEQLREPPAMAMSSRSLPTLGRFRKKMTTDEAGNEQFRVMGDDPS